MYLEYNPAFIKYITILNQFIFYFDCLISNNSSRNTCLHFCSEKFCLLLFILCSNLKELYLAKYKFADIRLTN